METRTRQAMSMRVAAPTTNLRGLMLMLLIVLPLLPLAVIFVFFFASLSYAIRSRLVIGYTFPLFRTETEKVTQIRDNV